MRAAAFAVVALAGCSLLSKAPPREEHDLSIGTTTLEPSAGVAPAVPLAQRPPLRLDRVTASPNLRHAIQHRVSDVEVAPYQTLRWTELPETYARWSLEHALFDRRFAQTTGDHAPALEVEVIAFEERSRAGAPGGRVQLRYELRDAQRVVARGVVTGERAAAGPESRRS